MNEYECTALELVMRYLDVAQAQLLLDEMDRVPGIQSARRALATAEEEVAKAHQAQTEAQAVVQSASSEVMLSGSRLKPNARRVSERKPMPRRATRVRQRVQC
jgi:hypothetical protein